MNESLRDIRGLDTIAWWPLAPGWWLVLLGFVGLISTIFFIRGYQRKRRQDWRFAAKAEWLTLRPTDAISHDQVNQLATLLKRIAIQRYGRMTCAGLSGQAWLDWLTTHDPQGFDWRQAGRILVELPYQPTTTTIARHPIEKIHQAMCAWIETPDNKMPENNVAK